MKERPDSPAPGDASAVHEGEPIAGMPRWVKLSGIAALLLVLMVVVMLLVGGGEHGPSRHGSGGSGTPAPAPPVAAAQVPVGGF